MDDRQARDGTAPPGAEASPPPRRIAVVVNRKSGSAEEKIEDALGLLRDHGFRVSAAYSTDIAEVRRLVAEAAAEADLVVVGGGDGTLSATLPVFLETSAVMGILPLGTANDLARSLGIPFAPVDAARVIVAGNRRAIDVGVVNGRPFFNAATIGLATEIAERHSGERKARLGLLNYPLCWFEALRDHRPFRARIQYDDSERCHRCTMLAVGNGRYHGGGMTIDKDASIDDGLLNVYFVKSVGLLRLLRVLFALRRGTLRRENRAAVLLCRTARITTSRPMPVNVDGEIVEQTPAEFSILPEALTVIAPGAPQPRTGYA